MDLQGVHVTINLNPYQGLKRLWASFEMALSGGELQLI